jgi:hypothetical protein
VRKAVPAVPLPASDDDDDDDEGEDEDEDEDEEGEGEGPGGAGDAGGGSGSGGEDEDEEDEDEEEEGDEEDDDGGHQAESSAAAGQAGAPRSVARARRRTPHSCLTLCVCVCVGTCRSGRLSLLFALDPGGSRGTYGTDDMDRIRDNIASSKRKRRKGGARGVRLPPSPICLDTSTYPVCNKRTHLNTHRDAQVHGHVDRAHLPLGRSKLAD